MQNNYKLIQEIVDLYENQYPTASGELDEFYKDVLNIIRQHEFIDNLTSEATGRWIIHFDDLFPEESTQECSLCHATQYLRYGYDDNYCPNCGAKMTGE